MINKKILNKDKPCIPKLRYNKKFSYTKRANEEMAKTRKDVDKIETEIIKIENRIRLLL
jgi:hypothetical protein